VTSPHWRRESRQANFSFFSAPFYGDRALSRSFCADGLPVPCASSNLTDAQIAAMAYVAPAKFSRRANKPLYGIDHLNSVVAPAHAPVPANSGCHQQCPGVNRIYALTIR